MKKRLISMLILIAYLIISFPVCMPAVAAQTTATVPYYSPAIKADVGDTVDLSGIGVQFENGVLTKADAITWASDAITISDGKIAVAQKGTYKLTATSGDKTKTVYLLAKNPEETEYVIFEDDFNVDKTLDEFKASGYTVPAKPTGHTIAVANGSLNFNTSTTKTTSQIVLPTWIGDFGNYSISADITVTEDYNTTQYFALTFRGQNELSYAPFYHTAYRSGIKTDCFELCHKYINTSGKDSWGTAIKASYSKVICDSVQRNYRVEVCGDNVKNYVEGNLIHDVDYIPASSNGHIEYYKGNVGMLVKGCDVQVDNIKVTLIETPDDDVNDDEVEDDEITESYNDADILIEVAKAYDRQGAQTPYDQYYARRSIYASPEDATAQRTFFLDCSSYVNSIYREAYGANVMPKEITNLTTGTSPSTENYNAYARDNQSAADVVGYWEPQTYTTDEERQAVVDWISANIEVGDVVVYRHGKTTSTKGHVYMYIGDNTFMHCAGSGSYVLNEENPALSYDSSASEITSNGTIGTVTFANIFTNQSSSRYIFKATTSDTVWSFAILRPLARGLTPTEETLNRMKIAGLSMEKTASVWENNTVNTDDILTYTVTMENTNGTALNGVTITDTLPEGTEFVSGDSGVTVNGNVLSWTGDVGGASTVKVNYSVKVTATVPGTLIISDATYVSGVKLGKITHVVSGYSKTQTALLSDTAVKYAEGSQQFTNGLEMAKEVYKSTFGVDVFGDYTVETALDQLIDTENKTRHTSTELSKMIAPNMYGAQAIATGRLYFPAEFHRTELPKEEHLAPGDIILADWSGGNVVYVYAGDKTLVTVEDGVTKTLTIGDDIYTPGDNILISLLGYQRYAVIRPSMVNSAPQIDVSSIQVTSQPSKTEYKDGDTFDKAGMVVQATMNDSSVKTLSAYTVSPKYLKYTDKYVTISFGNLSTTVDVTVLDVATSVSEAAALNVDTTARVEGIVVGVAHEGLNNDTEMLLKDVSNDTIMSVRNIPYGSFPNFGYEKGDKIVFEATVKKDTSSSTCYNEKKYLSFSSNNGEINETVISKGNEITYNLDNVTKLSSWEDMQAFFVKSSQPYTYVKISGETYCHLYHGSDTDNFRIHKNSSATDGTNIVTDGDRQVAIRNDVTTANIGSEWKTLLFGTEEVSTAYPGTEFDKEFYALYVGGNGAYYQLVILDEEWIRENIQESIVEYESNIIKANVGDIIPIDYYGVEFEADVPTSPADVVWASDDITISGGKITVASKGTYKLTATSGDKTKNIYILAKNPEDNEYVIYENDFEVDKTKAELVEDGFKHAEGHTTHVIATEDGALKISAAMGNKTTRFLLPAWIGDFGNYSISADVKITDKYATKQYFGLSFRGQQELGNAPFYNTTYRTEASSICFELCHKYIKSADATTSSWATATTAGYDESISDGEQRNFRVNVFDKNIKNFVDGQLIHDIDYIPKSANGNIEYYKGTVGLIVKGCDVEVDKITVTLMEKESDGIMTHVEDAPESNVQPAPMSVLSVDSEDDFNFEKAPTVAMLRANAALELVNAEGATVMTLAEALTRLDGKIIPAFRVEDASAVDAICEFIQKNFLTDAFIVSSNAEIIKSARAKLPMLRGVLDFSAATITDIYDVRKQTNESGSLICLLPESHADRKNVDYLLRLYMNVWVTMKEDTNVGAVAAITSGANGVVTGDVDLYNNALVTYFDNKTITRPVIVSGHRGAYYSEQTNTVAGILKAYELGAMSSEIDLRLTSDGVVILMHDSTIDRETTGSGTVSEMTYEEISQYQVDYTTAVTETRPVATFAEALAAIKDLDDYQLLVEIKDTNTEICQKIADLINEYDVADKINIIAYEGPIITAMREAMPEMSIGMLPETSKADDTDPEIEAYDIFNKLKAYNVFYAPNYEKIGLETLKALNDRGINVGAWTLNGKAVLNNHLTSGFASVTTNTITSFSNVNAKKWISTNSAEYVSDTGIVDVGLTATTYTRESVAVDNAKLVLIEGDDIFSYANGKIMAADNGSATLMLSAEFSDLNGGKINVVTEPFKVTVSVPEYEFATRDDSADVIKNDAVAVIAKAQDLATGSTVYASWKGVRYSFIVGANAFASVEEALANTDATQVIIPTTDTEIEVNISRSVDIYGENYDVMPWVVDGDDVVKSEAWGASGVSTVSKVNVTSNVVGATIKVMGVDITGRILDYVRSASDEKTDITIENTILYKNTSTGTTEFNLANKNNAKSTDGSKTNTDSFTIKNMLFINNAPHTEGRFFTEGQPAYFTIDGFACNDNMQTFGYPKWGKNVKAGKMTVTNCYIKNNKSTSSDYTPLVYFSGHNASTYTAEERSAMDISIEVSNNTLVDCGNPVTTVTSDCGSTLGVLEIYPGVFKTIDIINNEFISTGDDSTKIITWKGSESTATNDKDFSSRITFDKNRVIGYLPAVHVNNLTTVDLSGNYFETALDDFKAGAPGDTPADVDADTYIDYELTTKRSDMLPQSDALGLKTLMTIDTVYGYSAGNITAFDFTNANGVTYKVYSDADCTTEITSLDVTVGNASKAYVKATKGDISLVYTLIVIGVKDMADVANAKTSIEGIDDAALYYPSLYAQPNGIEVVTYYDGTPVKFTTGENVVTSQAQFGVFGDNIVIPDDITEVTFDILTKVSFHSAQEITTNFTKRKAKIAFVGDSIVEGRVVPEGTDQATFEYAYPAVVQNILGTTDFEIKNYGQSGRTVTSTAAIFNGTERSYKLSSASKTKYENSIAYNGDVVVISLGANDVNWAFWTSNDRLIQSYVALVRDYQALESKPTIYIQTATPRYDCTTLITARVAENLRHIQRVVADITGAQVIDSYNLMFDLFSAAGTEYSDDKLHPNKAGYEIYGTRMANELTATYTGASCQTVKVNGEDTLSTHSLSYIEGKESTVDEAGYKEHYKCEICNVYFEDEAATKVIEDIDAWKAGDGKLEYKAAVNEATGKEYKSINEAIRAAAPGETVKLVADVTEDTVMVIPGVTLDLNGYNLTSEYFVGLQGSNVIDTDVNMDGRITVAKNNVVLSKNNEYISVYDDVNKCYLFQSVSLVSSAGNDRWSFNADTYTYEVVPRFGGTTGTGRNDYHAMFADGGATTGVDYVIRVAWTDPNGTYTATQDFKYTEEIVATYFKTTSYTGKSFLAEFTGQDHQNAAELTIYTVVKSCTGVEILSRPKVHTK